MALTEFAVRKAKPKEKAYKLADGGGLTGEAPKKRDASKKQLLDGPDPGVEKKITKLAAESEARPILDLTAHR